MSLVLVAPPAQARPSPSKLKVTLSVSTKSATTGTPIRFSGRVSKGGSGAKAMLQRRQGSSAWSTVKASKVPQSRRVAFVVKAREGRSTYRIVIAKTKRTKRSTSPSATVTGRSRSTPPVVPSVTAGTILLTGTPTVGMVLRTSLDGWLPTAASFEYQWFRDSMPISAATQWDYRLTPADAGHQVAVAVTGSAPGYSSAARTSSTVVVNSATFGGTVQPSIVGEARVGIWLTAARGEWTPDPSNFSYQWLREGSPIPGATAQTYQLTTADIGSVVAVQVSASLNGYSSETRTSAPTTTVAPAQFATSPAPTVVGDAKLGLSVVASVSGWSPAPTSWTHQWLRDGVPITGATDGAYVITTADLGHRLSVRFTGDRSGYESVTRTSVETSAVLDPRPTTAQVIQRILADTNAFRAQNGKPALQLSAPMNTVAGNYAKKMHDTCTFEHNTDFSTQIPAGWTRAGENIAAGYDYTEVVNGWINSPGHRANLLGDFTHIGIGYFQGPNCYGTYFVQNFGKY